MRQLLTIVQLVGGMEILSYIRGGEGLAQKHGRNPQVIAAVTVRVEKGRTNRRSAHVMEGPSRTCGFVFVPYHKLCSMSLPP